MTRVGRAAALAAILLTATSCEELGNPDVLGHRTPPAEWSRGPFRLVTRSISVPPSRSNELLRTIAPAPPHHVDFFAPKGGVVTLVVVTPFFGAPPRLSLVPLVTEFRLSDGSTVRREWTAPASAPVFYGGFGLPSPPVEVVTSIGR
jgi:hypothetical protein